jgi:hypothetical protein
MNKIVHTEDIFPYLEEKLKTIESELLIVSAFVKVPALERIDGILNGKEMVKKLLVRFRKEDIVYGSTDLHLYEYCQQNGWDLYINFDLHSKIFVFDKTDFIIGSANVTLAGLGLSKKSNIETVCSGSLTLEEMGKIDRFYLESRTLDQELLMKMRGQLQEKTFLKDKDLWSRDITDNNKKSPEQLWVSEMIFSLSPNDMNSKDRVLLGVTVNEIGNISFIKEKFRESKCFRWLLGAIKEEIYFGELTKKLHEALIDNPSPYRKEVKQLLSNLLNWVNELKIEEISIDKPNVSQRIKKSL